MLNLKNAFGIPFFPSTQDISMNKIIKSLLIAAAFIAGQVRTDSGPIYEIAFAGGELVTLSIHDPLPGTPPAAAVHQAYDVIYPVGFETLTTSVPQCNPCDHGGNGDDMFDYHDHLFMGSPSTHQTGAFGAIWRVDFILPAYTGEPAHDA